MYGTPLEPVAPRFDSSLYAWVLSRYADVSAALREPLLSAVGARTEGNSPGSLDAQAHAQFRQLARTTMSRENVNQWRAVIEPEARRMLAALPSDRLVDLVGEFAEPWSRAVARTVTGVEPAPLESLARKVFQGAAEPYDLDLERQAALATAELATIFHGPLALQTFVALSQTLPCFLAGAWLALLQHPAEAVELHQHPDLMPAAIEELLRFSGPSRAQFRRAAATVHIGGTIIPEGQRVILMLAAANRDPEEFPEPCRLDLHRGAVNHLAFGAGGHSCVGASLIRMAASVATQVFLERFIGAELAGEVEWRGGFAILTPASLRVRATR